MAVLGIDIGGSGIKGAPVNTQQGVLTLRRLRIETPKNGKPDQVVECVGEIIAAFSVDGRVGLTFPGVVTGGTIRTAVNLHKSWVGLDLAALVEEQFGRSATVLNDADAAGVAEVAHGAAKGSAGVVVVLTFGTGVGSALFLHGRLVPNTELGHLEMNGFDAEQQVAERVREVNGWSWKRWANQANDYLGVIESLLRPDLIVVGGGIAKKAEAWRGLLRTRATLEVASLGNEAGIVGAAVTARRAASAGRAARTAG